MYREQFSERSHAATTADAIIADRVLVVIPCLNESAHIAALLADIVKDTAGLDRLIVVADGGSTDGTVAIVAAIAASEPCVALISNPKRLQSAGVNLAVRTFGEGRQWLVRLDAHAGYPPGYVNELIAEARRTGATSVVVAMTSQGVDGFQRSVALVQNSVLGAGGSPHRRAGKAEFVDHGHHALFDLQHFVAAGGYDENISHNEDAEFDVRLVRAGGRIWLTRAVAVVYYPRSSFPALYRQYLNYGRGRAATILRHSKLPKLRQVLPAAVAPAALALLLAPWLPLAAAPALLWAALCLGAGALVGRSLGVRGATLAGLAAMTIHFGWSIGFWSQLLSPTRKREPAFGCALSANDAAS